MSYLSLKETATLWNIPEDILKELAENNYIQGAVYDSEWKIPKDLPIPNLPKESNRYSYLSMSSAIQEPFSLSLEEIKLLLAQIHVLKAEYDKGYTMAEDLLKETSSNSIKNGCYMTLCLSSLGAGNLYSYRLYLAKLNEAPVSTRREHKEKELYLAKLHSNLYFQEMPDWLMEGDFDLLTKDTLPNSRNLFMFNHIKNAETVSMEGYRFLLSETRIDQAIGSEVYMLLLIASAYHYMADIDKSIDYIHQALDIAMPRGWYQPLIDLRISIGVLLDQEIKARDEKFFKHFSQAHKTYMEGWNRIYEYYKGEYPTKYLNLREEEIMFYVMNGKTNQEIADILCLSSETIKTNLKNIFQKTGVEKRSDLKKYMEESY